VSVRLLRKIVNHPRQLRRETECAAAKLRLRLHLVTMRLLRKNKSDLRQLSVLIDSEANEGRLHATSEEAARDTSSEAEAKTRNEPQGRVRPRQIGKNSRDWL
jgi:hypothetical protein